MYHLYISAPGSGQQRYLRYMSDGNLFTGDLREGRAAIYPGGGCCSCCQSLRTAWRHLRYSWDKKARGSQGER